MNQRPVASSRSTAAQKSSRTEQLQPSVFIASASESLHVLEAIQDNLTHDAWVRPWSQGLSTPSKSPLEVLIETAATSDFGIFVFAPNDVVRMRKRQQFQVRDNVLFELGIFIGVLGRERCFIVVPDDDLDLHLPTDLIGMTPVKYTRDPPSQNFVVGVSSACNEIRRQIQKHGPRARTHADLIDAVAKDVMKSVQDNLAINIPSLANLAATIQQTPLKPSNHKPKRTKASKVKPLV